jgi:hypothetical protein
MMFNGEAPTTRLIPYKIRTQLLKTIKETYYLTATNETKILQATVVDLEEKVILRLEKATD